MITGRRGARPGRGFAVHPRVPLPGLRSCGHIPLAFDRRGRLVRAFLSRAFDRRDVLTGALPARMGREASAGPGPLRRARARAHTHKHTHTHTHGGSRTKPRVRGPALQRGRRSAAACPPRKLALRTGLRPRRRCGATAPKRRRFRCGGAEEAPLRGHGAEKALCPVWGRRRGAASGPRRRKGAVSGVEALRRRRFAQVAALHSEMQRSAAAQEAVERRLKSALVRACVLAYVYRIDEVLMWRYSCGMPVQ